MCGGRATTKPISSPPARPRCQPRIRGRTSGRTFAAGRRPAARTCNRPPAPADDPAPTHAPSGVAAQHLARGRTRRHQLGARLRSARPAAAPRHPHRIRGGPRPKATSMDGPWSLHRPPPPHGRGHVRRGLQHVHGRQQVQHEHQHAHMRQQARHELQHGHVLQQVRHELQRAHGAANNAARTTPRRTPARAATPRPKPPCGQPSPARVWAAKPRERVQAPFAIATALAPALAPPPTTGGHTF